VIALEEEQGGDKGDSFPLLEAALTEGHREPFYEFALLRFPLEY